MNNPKYIFNSGFYATLIEELGDESLAWRLSYELGGMRYYIPSANNIYKRNQIQAQQMAAKGYSHNEIARRLGVHYNTARRAKKKLNNTSKQTELF